MLFFRRRLCWFFLVFFFLVVLSLLLLGILRTLITHEGPPSEIVRYEGEAPDSLRPARRFAPGTPHHNRHVKRAAFPSRLFASGIDQLGIGHCH
jgi:hypothetical protein